MWTISTKEKQMENRKALLGMFVMLLTFTLVLAACGSSPFALFGIGTTGAGKNAATDEFIETEEWVMVRIDEGKLGIIKYKGRSETVLVPAEFEGVPVVVFGDVFSGNTTLKSVSIPEGFTSISKDAFDGCTGLTSIAIPASVVSIGGDVDKAEDAFDGCTGLTDITVAEANEVYSAEDGVLFNKDKTTLFLCPEGKSGSYTIPPSVTGIAYCAFEICVKLTDVTIPDSVTSIGDAAFYKCAGLTSIIIPSRVMSIGAAAFFECTGLTSATISEGVTSIGERAFQDCTGLTSITIPASIKTITGDTRNEGVYGAFNGCTGLTSVTISEGVASIGATAFFGCTGLPSITIPDSVTYIGGNAFALCTSLTSVTISPVPGREWDFRGKKAGSVYWIFDSSPKLSSASKTALRNAGYQGQELSR
jgi:hypothetical protein